MVAPYELDIESEFPKDKSELVDFVRLGKARQYHMAVYDLNQRATNFTL